MGSQHHARQSRQRGDKIVGMLCLEMVGYYSLHKGSQAIPPAIPKWLHRFFPQRGNFLAAVGNMPSWKLNWQFRRGFKRGTRRMPLFSICLPEKINEIRLSDNSSFWDQGYPALMLTDTSYLRNPNYHQATDTPETLDYPRMTEVTLGVAAAMRTVVAVASLMCRRTFRRLGGVQFDEAFPLVRNVVFVEDRFGWTFWNAGSAVDAFIGVDVNHCIVFVKTFDRANRQARFVFAPNAGLSHHHRHHS